MVRERQRHNKRNAVRAVLGDDRAHCRSRSPSGPSSSRSRGEHRTAADTVPPNFHHSLHRRAGTRDTSTAQARRTHKNDIRIRTEGKQTAHTKQQQQKTKKEKKKKKRGSTHAIRTHNETRTASLPHLRDVILTIFKTRWSVADN
jgi:hypothetical protein